MNLSIEKLKKHKLPQRLKEDIQRKLSEIKEKDHNKNKCLSDGQENTSLRLMAMAKTTRDLGMEYNRDRNIEEDSSWNEDEVEKSNGPTRKLNERPYN